MVEPGPGLNLVVGPNGQGKTNLVESVAFQSWLRSFRSSRTADLLPAGCPAAVLATSVEEDGAFREVRTTIGPGWRKASIDGHAVRSSRDCLDVLAVVLLSPEDPALLDGGPDGRRALLDRLVQLADPGCAPLFSRYAALVKQRNSLLRADPGTWDDCVMGACEEALSAAGAGVVSARRAVLERVSGHLPSVLAELTGVDLRPSVRYASRWLRTGSASPDAVRDDLAGRLRSARQGDLVLGYTTAGPHADDLEIDLQGLKARGHASRGQKKALMLAWKAAEVKVFGEANGRVPVLVLDDALADLDADRQARVVAWLRAFSGQSFVTGAVLLDVLAGDGAVFETFAGSFRRREGISPSEG